METHTSKEHEVALRHHSCYYFISSICAMLHVHPLGVQYNAVHVSASMLHVELDFALFRAVYTTTTVE